ILSALALSSAMTQGRSAAGQGAAADARAAASSVMTVARDMITLFIFAPEPINTKIRPQREDDTHLSQVFLPLYAFGRHAGAGGAEREMFKLFRGLVPAPRPGRAERHPRTAADRRHTGVRQADPRGWRLYSPGDSQKEGKEEGGRGRDSRIRRGGVRIRGY